MLRLVVLFILLLPLLSSFPVMSADLQKGSDAYKKGDFKAALREYRPLAEQGNPEAQFQMGFLHLQGKGVPKNLEVAADWYMRAAKQGNLSAQVSIDLMYNRGIGLPKNDALAFSWWSVAAWLGDKSVASRLDKLSRTMDSNQREGAQQSANSLKTELQNAGIQPSVKVTRSGQLDAKKYSQALNMFDAKVSYPAPSWQKTTDAFKEIEYSHQANDNAIILEQIPKGQTFKSWTNLYAVTAQYSKTIPLSVYVNLSTNAFLVACGKENFETRFLAKNPNAYLFFVFCQNSANGPPHLGYGDGVGEISVMMISKHKDTFVKIYEQWRGKNFSVRDTNSWPVQESEMQKMAQRFKTIRIVDNPRQN